MKLYTFQVNEERRIGAEWDGQVADLTSAYNAFLGSQGPKAGALRVIPSEMLSFIRLGTLAIQAAEETIQFIKKRPAVPVGEQLLYPFEAVKVLPPVPRPGKILCCGVNYPGPNVEKKSPQEPFFFCKLPSTVIGPGESIVKPAQTEQMDFEMQLAVVIGKRMKRTPESEVMSSVFGYTLLHDLSARDVQSRDNQITLGKNFDTFCPLGPCIVTANGLEDPWNSGLRSMVNDQLWQSASTADWIFPLPKLLSLLSSVMTLEPGDVVGTGTPPGAGAFREPPVFLRPGDQIAGEIEGIGRLENPVVSEDR